MLELSSTRAVLAVLSVARRIAVEAYTLHGPVFSALKAAARRGASVTVALEGQPYDDPKGRLAVENRRLAADLRAAGVDAELGHPLHAKAIEADGTLYLDEKNWARGDLVLRDADAVEAAAIPMVKSEALASEGSLLRGARCSDAPIVESESFGCCNCVESALEQIARAGAAPRLIVAERELHGNARERAVLEKLAGEGVAVRVCPDSEKLAVAGERAWLGSANATIAAPDSPMTDWGVCTEDPQIVRAARDRLEAQWRSARPLTCQRV